MESGRISSALNVADPSQSLWDCTNPTCVYQWPRAASRLRDEASTSTSILLIDDNEKDRTYFANALKRRSSDYEILEAGDGQSGLRLFDSQRFDCVVLALDLPDHSGFQILVDLVPLASRPRVAIVVVTHRLQRGLHELAMKNGAQACCVKPFTSDDELHAIIQRAIARVGSLPKEDR